MTISPKLDSGCHFWSRSVLAKSVCPMVFVSALLFCVAGCFFVLVLELPDGFQYKAVVKYVAVSL